MKTFILLVSLVLTFVFGANAQTTIEGKVLEKASGEPIGFADVALYLDGNLVTGAQSDFDGNYCISNIEPGTYSIEVSDIEMKSCRIIGVVVNQGKIAHVNFKLTDKIDSRDNVIIETYNFDNSFISEMTRNNLNTLIQNLPSKSFEEMKGIGRFRSNVYYINGERSDEIRRDKKYWFTPLDSIGPQGLSPEYASPHPVGHPSPFWRREE